MSRTRGTLSSYRSTWGTTSSQRRTSLRTTTTTTTTGPFIFFHDVRADDDVDVNVDDVSPDDVPGGRRSRYDDDDDDDRDDASDDVRATDGVCIVYGSLLRLFGESYITYADVRSRVRSDVGV